MSTILSAAALAIHVASTTTKNTAISAPVHVTYDNIEDMKDDIAIMLSEYNAIIDSDQSIGMTWHGGPRDGQTEWQSVVLTWTHKTLNHHIYHPSVTLVKL